MEPHDVRDHRLSWLGTAILAVLCISLTAMIGRLAYINTALAPKLTGMARTQQLGKQSIPARRGFIFDTTGRVVAGTWQRPSVFADPPMIEDLPSAVKRLSPILGVSPADLTSNIENRASLRFCWLKRLIDPVDANAVRKLNLRGIGVRYEPQRLFPMETLMAQVLGIVGRDGTGLEGAELYYDTHLRGRDGKRASVYDGRRRRRPIWFRGDLSHPERDGGHVVLTLDCVIQGILEHELEAAVEEFEADLGVGLVLSPTTGELLAVGQYPTFDPNRYDDYPPDRRRLRAVTDAIEPGSTFKPYVVCGALLTGAVDPKEEVFCHNGVHWFSGRRLRDSSPHGALDLEGIIAKSSNIGMGIIGERMGNAAIFDIVSAFGYGQSTGINFPGETPGLVRPLDSWTSYSTTSVPMGQEIAVTPLQLAAAFAAIVNGGHLLQPILVRALLTPDGAILEESDAPRRPRRVIPQRISDYMRAKALAAVVERGGGRSAALRDWRMVGKTGTAEVAFKDRRGYEPGAYVSSFIGAAPLEDPQAVILVMIHKPNPELGYYGGTVAAPAVGKIMEQTLAYLQVPPSPPAQNGRIAGLSP